MRRKRIRQALAQERDKLLQAGKRGLDILLIISITLAWEKLGGWRLRATEPLLNFRNTIMLRNKVTKNATLTRNKVLVKSVKLMQFIFAYFG